MLVAETTGIESVHILQGTTGSKRQPGLGVKTQKQQWRLLKHLV